MARTEFKTIDEYIDTFPPDVRDILEKIRSTVRKAVPGAEEAISYQMPTFRFHGVLLNFAAFKNHFSLFGAAARSDEAFKERLAPYVVSKGTLRFPLDTPVPVGLIRDIARFGAKENLAREAAKKAARQKPRRTSARSHGMV